MMLVNDLSLSVNAYKKVYWSFNALSQLFFGFQSLFLFVFKKNHLNFFMDFFRDFKFVNLSTLFSFLNKFLIGRFVSGGHNACSESSE